MIFLLQFCRAENGYDLWLGHRSIEDPQQLARYRAELKALHIPSVSPTMIVVKNELTRALRSMLNKEVPVTGDATQQGTLIAGLSADIPLIREAGLEEALAQTGTEGFIITSKNIRRKQVMIITAQTETGILYGTFHLLRLIRTGASLKNLHIISVPKIQHRLLNHWDNLDRTVERGYAGFSIWDWHKLPGYTDQRYIDYARANASLGINGTVLTNVNANATILTPMYLEKVKALADIFRPYGIKVYLTARFSAPIELGKLNTADPLDPQVQQWWKDKVEEIYRYVPDFGGFLVKANSEGQPGPQDYKRTHADGANMLADAVAPFKGIVMWRAFVYSAENPVDRHKQAYDEFVPLDGSFRENVIVQVKNGAIDFMPREPFHPLFGATPKTPLMMEFQITQEYLGQGTTLAYLAPLFKECLDSDTYQQGPGSTVAKVIDGSVNQQRLTGIAGVANIGNDINWTGHLFGQSNWYAWGRLAWDHELSSEQLADEWIRMTFSNPEAILPVVKKMMLDSREIVVSYSNPIGLHHLMGTSHHYGPAPWVSNLSRPEWNPVYYHRADAAGIGFDRTKSGSNALEQYHPDARKIWEDSNTCDEKNLLWFHHVSWDFKMNSGRTLWEELCFRYYDGAEKVRQMGQAWDGLRTHIDPERHKHVAMLLKVQHDEAIWWRNSCLLYFQTFSRRPLPNGYEKPDKDLEYYKSLRFPFAPGI